MRIQLRFLAYIGHRASHNTALRLRIAKIYDVLSINNNKSMQFVVDFCDEIMRRRNAMLWSRPWISLKFIHFCVSKSDR